MFKKKDAEGARNTYKHIFITCHTFLSPRFAFATQPCAGDEKKRARKPLVIRGSVAYAYLLKLFFFFFITIPLPNYHQNTI